MVRLFETRRGYNARMKRRSNILKSNAALMKLIKEYRTLENRSKRANSYFNKNAIFQITMPMEYNIIYRTRKLLSNHGINPNRNLNPSWGPPYKMKKILAAVPNTRSPYRTPPPKYVYVNNPNGSKAVGVRNFRSN